MSPASSNNRPRPAGAGGAGRWHRSRILDPWSVIRNRTPGGSQSPSSQALASTWGPEWAPAREGDAAQQEEPGILAMASAEDAPARRFDAGSVLLASGDWGFRPSGGGEPVSPPLTHFPLCIRYRRRGARQGKRPAFGYGEWRQQGRSAMTKITGRNSRIVATDIVLQGSPTSPSTPATWTTPARRAAPGSWLINSFNSLPGMK